MRKILILGTVSLLMLCAPTQAQTFHLQEATIDSVHAAISSGQITCRGLVQLYLNRAKAYNGPGTQLVTEKIAPELFPNYTEYLQAVEATKDLPFGDPRKTVPLEFGRMEPTSTDPTVQRQYGWIEGIPNS